MLSKTKYDLKIHKNLLKTARKVLEIESDAVKSLIDYLNSDFEGAVECILESRGRVVVTGIGKSANIAQKIVATLNSTGTPAIFMHAADAIHGDLGMVQQNDVVICISKSGNTSEIKVLVPLIKRLKVKLIALVSDTTSFLAHQADFLLNATITEEACPHGLAPTTSTTAHLALGDALAICLLEQRNFNSEDFARYHPGGTLGKKLYLKVDEIYKNNENPRVREGASFKDVVVEISSKRLGATAVVADNGVLLGIITDGDIRRCFENFDHYDSVTAGQIYSRHPKTIRVGEFASTALQKMQDNNISQLIVVNAQNEPVGFVHLHDLLKEGIV